MNSQCSPTLAQVIGAELFARVAKPLATRRIRRGFPASSFYDIACVKQWGAFMRKKNVEVYELALKMAGSGEFKSWKGIRDGLVEKGYRRAPELLDGDKIRMILDLHCAGSQKAETDSK